MSTLSFRPPKVEIASVDTVRLEFEMADLLAADETVASPTVTLTNLATGASYPAGLSGAATVNGTCVRQAITALVAGQRYRLVVAITPLAGKTLSADLVIEAPY